MPFLTANPLLNPAAYDQIVIAGVAWPRVVGLDQGLVKVSGAARVYSWDVKDSPGTQGSTLTYRGFKPTDSISIRFEFWLPQHITDFYTNVLPLLEYDAGKSSPKPVTVVHPVLQAQGITALVIKQIGQLTEEDKQLWSLTVEAIEYRPAGKGNATTTPKAAQGTAPGAPTAANPSVLDEQDLMIQQLLAEAKKPLPEP